MDPAQDPDSKCPGIRQCGGLPDVLCEVAVVEGGEDEVLCGHVVAPSHQGGVQLGEQGMLQLNPGPFLQTLKGLHQVGFLYERFSALAD